MNPLNQEEIIARQRARILTRLENANQLIDDYEKKRLSSSDPTEKLHAKERIAEIEELIEQYQSQLTAIGEPLPAGSGMAPNNHKAQERTSNRIEKEKLAKREEEQTSVPNV